MKQKNDDVELWLSLSHALFHDLAPKDAGAELFNMKKSEHAFLVHRETKRVNNALVSMSLAEGEAEVRGIFSGLSRDTVIALLSRWVHYHAHWQKMERDTVIALLSRWVHYHAHWQKMENERNPHLWVPPDHGDIWRAIFLAMTDDTEAASTACKQIWPELFGV